MVTGRGVVGVRLLAVELDTHDSVATAEGPGDKRGNLWQPDLPLGAPDRVIDYVIKDIGDTHSCARRHVLHRFTGDHARGGIDRVRLFLPRSEPMRRSFPSQVLRRR